MKKTVVSYLYVPLWIFLSCSVIVFNKYILDKNLYNWPYPIRSAPPDRDYWGGGRNQR